ncbi:hypothetical protein EG327_006800 [Venturia inaequalis]|uniref:Uncharacterized protein n=1 Tax=Venturia inaequalis TaxID=5025 RepID=A0A8H3VU95_VENIN|nr:hypothetical protein EG327_006800 [Venturia inaequalis]
MRTKFKLRPDGDVGEREEYQNIASTQSRPKKSKRRRRKPGQGNTELQSTEEPGLSTILVSLKSQIEQDLLQRPRDLFAKEWDPHLSRPGPGPLDDDLFVDSSRQRFLENQSLSRSTSTTEDSVDADPDGNGISILLRDFDDPMALIHVNQVEEFCQNVSLEALESGAELTAGYRRASWVDERQLSQGRDSVRKHANPLTATALYRILRRPRYRAGDRPDASRRLIYIRNLDKWFILALAETVPFHQVRALRDAIGNHLKRKTSVRVHMGVRCHPNFQLNLHIPSRPKRETTNLSFLDSLSTNRVGEKPYLMQEAMFSFVICGSSNHHYVGYCFDDRDDGDCEGLEEMEFAYQGIHEDPIASDCGGNFIDANMPIRNSRAYHAKASIAFDWHRDIKNLLGKILPALSETLQALDVFRSLEGDSSYFNDVGATGSKERRSVLLSLRSIEQTLESIRTVYRSLSAVTERCDWVATNLSTELNLRLTIENNEATQSTVSTTEWTICFFSPLALTIAYFSMPQEVIPFHMTFKSWLLSLLVAGVVVKVLYFVFAGRLRQSDLWRGVVARIKVAKLSVNAPSVFHAVFGHAMHFLAAISLVPRRGLPVDASREGIELQELECANRV